VKDYSDLAELYGTWYYLVVRHCLIMVLADGNERNIFSDLLLLNQYDIKVYFQNKTMYQADNFR
jgi:hypothetical protein